MNKLLKVVLVISMIFSFISLGSSIVNADYCDLDDDDPKSGIACP